MRLYRFNYALAALSIVTSCQAFGLVREYAGSTFFDGWDFYGFSDNLTFGNVNYLDAQTAATTRLAYINDAGNAIMKVDNTSLVGPNGLRNSVRITSQDFYDWGSLWIIDLLHIPYGCSVWPAFWSKGTLWPNDGEIDIIEAINLMDHNQVALHTTDGCLHNLPVAQTGHNTATDCGKGSGCVVAEAKPNSYGAGFAAAGGGVWATQFDVSGIYMWFWSRKDIPPSIAQANSTSSIDISQWGTPSAAYPATSECNITQFFTPQQLIFDITLCGDWAGVPGIYANDCAHSGTNGTCYGNNVVGPGSPMYDNAYFEVSYVRAYSTAVPTPTASSQISLAPTTFNLGGQPAGTAEITSGGGTFTVAPTHLSGSSSPSGMSAALKLSAFAGVSLYSWAAISLVFTLFMI